MVKGKGKNLTNRNQDHTPSSEPSTPIPPQPVLGIRTLPKPRPGFKGISHDDGRRHQEGI